MKNDPVIGILTGVVAIIALASVVMFALWVRDSRELRALNTQVQGIAVRQRAVNALAADAIRYGQKDPSILPVLEASNVRVRGTNQPATR